MLNLKSGAAGAALAAICACGVSARALEPEEREALAQVDASQNATFAQCTDAQGARHLVVRVSAPQVRPNGFAPALTPTGPAAVGYYDFMLYRRDDGRYNIGLDYNAERVTVADRQNGVEALYSVRLTIPAYRIYDARTGRWTDWSSGSSYEREKINFVNYRVVKKNGVWSVDATYNIMTNGRLEKPNCSETPA